MIADLDGADARRSRARSSASRARLAAELRAFFETEEPFRAADLPGELDDEGRLVLVRRLVREGFLRRQCLRAR